ncbi:MAG: helix-turn-helix transcriptional regulator [Bacteroidales bacterium]|nr:helix-turn-helix transcriptional regulator [Bacteroidales bacterium]
MLSDKIDFLQSYNPKALSALIADRVRRRRLSANLTQQALSIRSGVSLGTLKRFENLHEISLKHLLMLAVALQATDEFSELFPDPPYRDIDDVLKEQQVKKRQRGRKKA